MGNEDEVVNVLKKGNLLDLQVVDTAKMSYSEQLKVSSSNVSHIGFIRLKTCVNVLV